MVRLIAQFADLLTNQTDVTSDACDVGKNRWQNVDQWIGLQYTALNAALSAEREKWSTPMAATGAKTFVLVEE